MDGLKRDEEVGQRVQDIEGWIGKGECGRSFGEQWEEVEGNGRTGRGWTRK